MFVAVLILIFVFCFFFPGVNQNKINHEHAAQQRPDTVTMFIEKINAVSPHFTAAEFFYGVIKKKELHD